MRHIFLTAFSLVFTLSVAEGQWAYTGLAGKKINRLRVHSGFIYAATTNGLYKKAVTTTDTNWSLIGFSGKQVNCVHIVSSNRIYSGVQHSGIGTDTMALFITNDTGSNWAPVWGGYSSFSMAYAQVNDIEVLQGANDTLIIIADGIRKSINGGQSFALVNVMGGRFLTIASNNANMLWTGGEGVLLDPVLIQTTTKGDTWFYNDSVKQVVSGDNACLSAGVHPYNHNTVYIGMEGQVARSADNGVHWAKILANDYYIKGIKVSPSNQNIIYATGGTFGGEEIPLFMSMNEGSTWDTLKHYTGPTIDVLDLAVTNATGKDIVYVGTRDHGVYKYETNITAVTAMMGSSPAPVIYPNPFSTEATVHFNNPRNETINAIISDLSGRLIRTEKIKGETFVLNRYSMAAGAYIITFTNKAGEKQVCKFEVE